MRIHTDNLSADLIRGTVLQYDGLYPGVVAYGSRKRKGAFALAIDAEPGEDYWGIGRVYARNSGTMGAACGYGKAATWIEWGDVIAELFKLDPTAIIGQYDGADNFVAETLRTAAHRPERERAPYHAARWARALERDVPVRPEHISAEAALDCLERFLNYDADGDVRDEWPSGATVAEELACILKRAGRKVL